MKRIILFFSFLAAIAPSWAISPMEYYDSLVAGGRDAGFRDGAFSLARFHDPLGMALDEAGNKLYVADSSNHRIRVVNLDQNNDVKTLAGTDSAGAMDGPVSTATFNVPAELAALPGNRLAVYDAGNGIRLIDIQKQTVSTIAKGVQIRNMVYRPQDDSLYFSGPDNNKVEKLNMKTLAISLVFSDNPLVPSPGAICLYQDKLCVADTGLTTIYEVKLDDKQSSVTVSAPLSAVGSAKEVLALASSDGALYALQRDGLLVKVGLPNSSIVNFQTPWGFSFNNQDHHGSIPLFNTHGDIPIGFLGSPTEPGKFFIATEHSIVSIKDYDFQKWWPAWEDNDDHLTDFDYPTKKPARTFRILVTGASRNSTAVLIPSDPNENVNEDTASPRVFTYSKRLELQLNTEAVLRNLNIHFEVLNLTRRGGALSSYGYYEVPDFVKKYDIDLVLGLADQTGYKDYYLKPLGPEGIPAKSVDYEYLLKPLSARAFSGVAKDLLERCKKLKIPVSEKQDFPGDGMWSLFYNEDAQIQADLREMTGRGLQLLQDKLNSMKTSGGNPPQFVLFYVPGGSLPSDCTDSFWNDVCTQYHFKFIDLSESFNALRISYSPTYVDHFTVYGNELISLLLDHYLVEDKLVPQ
jgi:hypothetical protein